MPTLPSRGEHWNDPQLVGDLISRPGYWVRDVDGNWILSATGPAEAVLTDIGGGVYELQPIPVVANVPLVSSGGNLRPTVGGIAAARIVNNGGNWLVSTNMALPEIARITVGIDGNYRVGGFGADTLDVAIIGSNKLVY